jgi:uncharacterized membrane protein YdjX (TVP38/TMEM64 family)
LSPTTLWLLCLLLFLDGATFSFATTPLLLEGAKYHSPWVVALAGGLSSGLGSVLQYRLLRWILHGKQPWMKRFAPSRGRLEAALRRYPSTSFATILLARATPLPDAPVKLVAALVGYPASLYFLAILLGALPYYFVIAVVGRIVKVPGWILGLALLVLALVVVLDQVRRRSRVKA